MVVVDTCILIDVADDDPDFGEASTTCLAARVNDGLTISPVSYVELAPVFDGSRRFSRAGRSRPYRRILRVEGCVRHPPYRGFAEWVAGEAPREGRCLMVVVSNRIPVARGHEEEFAARFRDRAGLVERHPGFVKLEILRPEPIELHGQQMGGSDYHVVLTYWQRKEDFVAWTASEDFRKAHSQRPPAEMFAGPNVFELHEIIQSAGAS